MFTEKELLEKFQVEELEKRFEMGWIKGGSVTGHVGSDGVYGEGTLQFGNK